MRCLNPGQRDAIVCVVGYDGVCSDLLDVGRRCRVIRKQGSVELQYVMRGIDVRDCVVAETRIERENVVAVTNRVSLPLPSLIVVSVGLGTAKKLLFELIENQTISPASLIPVGIIRLLGGEERVV